MSFNHQGFCFSDGEHRKLAAMLPAGIEKQNPGASRPPGFLFPLAPFNTGERGADPSSDKRRGSRDNRVISYRHAFIRKAAATQGVRMHRFFVAVLSGLLLAGFLYASYAAYSGLLSMPGWGVL